MLPASFLQIAGRAAFFLTLALLAVDVKAKVAPPFSFTFFRLVPSSLFLLTSSPSATSAQGQGQGSSHTHSNSIGKSHRPSTGPFPQPPFPPLLSDIVASEETRFSTNRPQKELPPLAQQQNHFIFTQPTDSTTTTTTTTTTHNNHNNDDNENSPLPQNPRTTMMTSSPVLAHFPDPIVYQFTLYYPGNMPLIVTAGHGGWEVPDSPVKRRMTHRFTPVDLASPISVPAFSTPVEDSAPDKPEVMLWMPERDQTKGGNFKMDINTHSAALNLAGAVACIVNEGQNGHQLNSSVPPKCDFADSDDPDTPPPKMPSLQDTLTQGQESSPFYYPHVVVFRVQRRFVDVNRNVSGENAIADHPVAEAAWNEYHVLIEHVQRLAAQRHPDNELRGPSKNSLGLLLDIHGHGHATNLIEVGYLLNGTTLALDDKHLDTHANVLTNLTSIRSLENLIRQNPNPANREDHENDDHGHNDDDNDDDNDNDDDMITFSDLLRGQKNSLGGMLQSHGLDSLPSPRYQAPSRGAVYFYGGYTTQRHGSRDKPEDAMDAIQLEMPRTLRFVEKDEGREIGMRMGRAVVEFMTRYYQLPLSMNRVTMPETESMLGGLNKDTKAAWSSKEQKPIRSGAWESGDSDDNGGADPKKAKALTAKRQTSRL